MAFSIRHVTGETDLNEHAIRLRGGWECRSTALGESVPRRIVLPTQWTSEHTGLATLTRRFGRPPFYFAGETLSLRLDQVPGIHALRFNGQSLAPVSPDRAQFEFPLAGLRDRNQLDVEVDVRAAGAQSAWGLISLVIRTPVDSG